MNVERLELLAATVEKGYHVFDGKKVGFNMATFYTTKPSPYVIRSNPEGFDAVACLIGFTILLFGGDKSLLENSDDRGLTESEQDQNSINLDVEAWNLLDINEADSHELFYGCLSRTIDGKTAAKVIRKFLKTGKVDWSSVQMAA